MSIRKLIYIITILGVFAMAARFSIDTDTWWHLRAGQWIWGNKTIPRTDPFSYTKYGSPWHYPGWVMQIGLFSVYKSLGSGGLNLMTAVFVALTFFFLWKTIHGNNYFKAFVVVLAATASGVYWAARPYLITFLFSAVFLFLLEKERKSWCSEEFSNKGSNKVRLWILPPLMVIWANGHGGFAVGFILFGIYFIGLTMVVGLKNIYRYYLGAEENNKRDKDINPDSSGVGERERKQKGKDVHSLKRWGLFFFIGVLLVVAVCLNPHGPKMFMYPFKTVGMSALNRYIEEWQSPNFHELRIQPFLILLFLTFGAVGASKKQISIIDFLLVFVFGALSLMAGRNIALFALAAPVVLTRHGVAFANVLGKDAQWLRSGTKDASSRTRNLLHWVILILVVFAVGYKTYLVLPESKNEEYVNEYFPVEAVEYLKEIEFGGRLFNSYNWGGYLIWALPEHPVFIDGRTDLYEGEIIDQWVSAVQAEEGWENILEGWGVEVVLLEPFRPLVDELGEQGWVLGFEDEQAVIFMKE